VGGCVCVWCGCVCVCVCVAGLGAISECDLKKIITLPI